MRHIEPKDLSISEVLSLLLGGINPRPIALVATISENGNNNLAPFSFFNAFGANPPIVAFSPSSRVRDGSHKDTYHNLKRTKECTIQVVTFDMVEQVNLASTEYETGIDEFVKSGLTPIPSDLVKSARVKESPFQMECRLNQIVYLGEGKGSGNLMICEVIKFHIDEWIMEDNQIDPFKMDLVARNGANYYTRASGDAIFEVERPLLTKGIGYDQLPESMKLSSIFTGNDLAKFGNSEKIPSHQEVCAFIEQMEKKLPIDPELEPEHLLERAIRDSDYEMMLLVGMYLKKQNHLRAKTIIERAAQVALHNNQREFAWNAAMLSIQFDH